MPYPTIRHKEAYEMWKSGWSIKKISSLPNMPDRRELREWMKPSYNCRCGYHGWMSLRRNEIAAIRGENAELLPEEKAAFSELEEELNNTSSNELSPQLLKALSDAIGVQISKELTGDLQADMVSTAYMILARVREVLPEIQIKDAFALRQILGVAVQILTAFRPVAEVQRDEVTDIKIEFPEYPKGMQRIEETVDEDG